MILHIDMDAFYAAIEQRDCPELKGRCVVVGGTSNRGVVATASYEARKFGVRSAMPIFEAKQRCPHAVFLPPRIGYYRSVSEKIIQILESFSPLVEPVSIDEAYVDVTGCQRYLGTTETIATDIKRRIREQTALSCSIGAAPVKFLAKIASDIRKPDGCCIIYPEQMTAAIEALPIEKVPGVGKKTAVALSVLQIRFLGDVNRFSRETLVRRLGKYGHRLADLAAGRDDSEVTPVAETKSISSEITLSADTDSIEVLCRHLLLQSERVAKELREKRVRAKTVTLKLKHADFKQVTRNKRLSSHTQSAEALYKVAEELLSAYRLTTKIRLIGIGASGLISQSAPAQLSLFDGSQRKSASWRKVETALDDIRRKFGNTSVCKASLVAEEKK